ncbi:MAG: cytochrome d ubiquinol oxidase subunit II [Rhodospirillum sp.]|nr:cytochrome d ubiquinol oxidase subunit II [Rhodospirillum sp.]MCF8491860.1 cytochrome d ubiquinol oxidase subunit II [Rhodospirillum sp.]MCF8501139.1 cytochrome d ubiquinol oxidase subunit II [Rhodospirillum sp.]
MALDLPLIWGVLIALAVFLYTALDGFDLGVGILFPVLGAESNRDRAMNSIAPIWDGNETWLVLGGGGLFAAFPLAYSVLLTAFYPLIIGMLLALVFRGVAFEFRFKAATPGTKASWSVAFWAGSLTASVCQGIMLGAFIQGIAVNDGGYAGGWFDWLSPFSLLTGVAVPCGYALLGSGWLAMKADGGLADMAYRYATRCGLGTVGFIVLVSACTPLVDPDAMNRWFGQNMILYGVAPVAVAVLAVVLQGAIAKRRAGIVFFASQGLFCACYLGFAITKYPFIIPNSVTFRAAAADASALGFLLPGALVLLPIILGYTAYAYWIFRGKTSTTEGYH